MKIFGLNINFGTKKFDKVVVRHVTPKSTPVSKIPLTKVVSLSYAQQYAGARGLFIGAEYDLSEIGKIEDVDGFVRQSFKKKEGLMFKEGVSVKGANKQTVQYYKARMAQIARASNIPTLSLLKRTARSLIRTSNAFLIKSREAKSSGGKVRVSPSGKTLDPIAGYFPAAPETMQMDLNEDSGKITGWRQILPSGKYVKFAPEDVVHFYIDKREGFSFGVPTIIPVIDDIRALRQIEENIELLLYQNLFPLFHYKVGTETAPAGYTEDGSKEVDLVEQQIKLMPSEGAIVTPERHDIKAIGSEGRALRAEGYLTHFKKRVFAGLGVSEVDMGDGQTANRATANVLSRALIDAVKAIQDDLEVQWDHHIITELLLESTFGDDVLEDVNMVRLQFAEIDIQNKMDQEEHLIDLFKSNAITYSEFRSDLAREPIPIPEDPNDQDPSKYPEWFETYWKLFDEPANLIRAVDEPYSAASQMASEARSSSLTEKHQQVAQQAKEKEVKVAAEEDRKTKIAVSKAKVSTKDHFLRTAFNEFEEETANRLMTSIHTYGNIDSDYMLGLARIWAAHSASKMTSLAISELVQGFNEHTGFKASEAEILLSIGRKDVSDRINFRIDKLVENTISLVLYRVDSKVGDVKLHGAIDKALEELHIAFDATRYRVNFIWDVEIRKAYMYGKLLGMKHLGEYGFELIAAEDACDKCKSVDGQIILASAADINSVPPLHPNSKMKIKLIRKL